MSPREVGRRHAVHEGRQGAAQVEVVQQKLGGLLRGDPVVEFQRADLRLDGVGRLLIRKSGTEPLVRVMADCEDEGILTEVVDGIVAEVESAAA